MAVLHPRNRLVYFRVSEDEFLQLVSMCETEGLRSISDVARSAVKRMIDDSAPSSSSRDEALKVLSENVAELGRNLEWLIALLRSRENHQKNTSETAYGDTSTAV